MPNAGLLTHRVPTTLSGRIAHALIHDVHGDSATKVCGRCFVPACLVVARFESIDKIPQRRVDRPTQCFAPNVQEQPAADKHELGSHLLDGVDASLPRETGRDARGTEQELADDHLPTSSRRQLVGEVEAAPLIVHRRDPMTCIAPRRDDLGQRRNFGQPERRVSSHGHPHILPVLA